MYKNLDKFYTQSSCSKKCIDKVFELYPETGHDLIVEPSAGNGSFLNQITSKNKIGIKFSETHLINLAEANRLNGLKRKGMPQPILICPHCNKSGGNIMRRYHFDNCKLKF